MRPLLFLLLLCACSPALQVEVSKTKNLPVTISYENLSLSVDPEIGGRVTRYEINGINVLKPNRNKTEMQYGSSTWTSPQSAWIEAVEPPFNNRPFQIIKQGKWSMTLLSEQDKNTGLQLKKSFRFSPVETWIYLLADYTLYNNGQDTLFRGLWENSSVAYDGAFTFYADSVKTDTDIELAKKKGEFRITMLPENDAGGKIFVYPGFNIFGYENRGLRWTKTVYKFVLSERHPEHSPLELYFSPEKGMAEYSVHGGFRRLEPGDSTILTVMWRLEEVD